ncbi:hypothetical protein V1520DRAFT_329410 [Lipomyces starkeyi]
MDAGCHAARRFWNEGTECLSVCDCGNTTAVARAERTCKIIKDFHGLNKITSTVDNISSLIPPEISLGRTIIRPDTKDETRYIYRCIPDVEPLNSSGVVQSRVNGTRVNGPDSSDPTIQLRAKWDTPVLIIVYILQSLRGPSVVPDDVLQLAQQSPDALEILKAAGKSIKSHFNRLLSIVEMRRSPESTRHINHLLALRDGELSKHDSAHCQCFTGPGFLVTAASLYGGTIEDLVSEDVILDWIADNPSTISEAAGKYIPEDWKYFLTKKKDYRRVQGVRYIGSSPALAYRYVSPETTGSYSNHGIIGIILTLFEFSDKYPERDEVLLLEISGMEDKPYLSSHGDKMAR